MSEHTSLVVIRHPESAHVKQYNYFTDHSFTSFSGWRIARRRAFQIYSGYSVFLSPYKYLCFVLAVVCYTWPYDPSICANWSGITPRFKNKTNIWPFSSDTSSWGWIKTSTPLSLHQFLYTPFYLLSWEPNHMKFLQHKPTVSTRGRISGGKWHVMKGKTIFGTNQIENCRHWKLVDQWPGHRNRLTYSNECQKY